MPEKPAICLLAKHEPRPLDPTVEQELRQYVVMVRQRNVTDFEAAEWER